MLGWRLRVEPRHTRRFEERSRWAHHLASWTVAATGEPDPCEVPKFEPETGSKCVRSRNRTAVLELFDAEDSEGEAEGVMAQELAHNLFSKQAQNGIACNGYSSWQ